MAVRPAYGNAPPPNANAVPLGSKPAASDSEASDQESDSDDETEDEDGDELTAVMDAAILRTLTRIRKGEGVELGRNVFEEEQAALLSSNPHAVTQKKAVKATKPVLLADFQRQALLDSARPSPAYPNAPPPGVLTHAEEQDALRKEMLSAFALPDAEGVDGEDEGGGLFEKKDVGAAPDEDMEDEEYRAFLLGSGGGEEGIRQALGLGGRVPGEVRAEEDDADEAAPEEAAAEDGQGEKKKKKKSKKAKPAQVSEEEKRAKDEEFLLDYILNRGWIDRSTTHVPSYSEITAPKPKKKRAPSPSALDTALSGDEGEAAAAGNESDFDDKADEFETRYNFRFEEPGADQIPTHPRSLPSVVRREDTSRKDARAARKAKKAEEKARREEERKKVKAAKKKEIEKKLLLLGIGKGGRELTLDDLDLDADFDPEAHDRKIAELFESGNDWADDDGEKPTWDDEDGGAEGYLYGMEDGGEGGDEDEDRDGDEGAMPGMDLGAFDGQGMSMDMDDDELEGPGMINMDADAMDDDDDDPSSSRKDKKKKKKSKKKKGILTEASALLAQPDDVDVGDIAPFEGTEEEKKAKIDEMMDEYYALDHEDMIGDRPVRFTYTKTAPQNYGLTPAEILMATDAELNTFLGVKQYAAFRADGGAGAGRVGRDKRLWELKGKLKGRRWGEDMDLSGQVGRVKGQPVKRERATGANGEKLPAKKRKGKKERLREKAGGEGEAAAAAGGASEPAASAAPAAAGGDDEGESRKKKKRKVEA